MASMAAASASAKAAQADVDMEKEDMDGSDAAVVPPKVTLHEPDSANRERFLVELEFVQCLSNPFYLKCNGSVTHATHTRAPLTISHTGLSFLMCAQF